MLKTKKWGVSVCPWEGVPPHPSLLALSPKPVFWFHHHSQGLALCLRTCEGRSRDSVSPSVKWAVIMANGLAGLVPTLEVLAPLLPSC